MKDVTKNAKFIEITDGGGILKLRSLALEIYSELYGDFGGVEGVEALIEEKFSVEKFLTAIGEKRARCFLIFYKKRLAGYTVLKFGDGRALLSKLYFRKEFRGLGLGRVAMERLKRLAAAANSDDLWLVVLNTNSGAVRFYEREGFVPTDRVSPLVYEDHPPENMSSLIPMSLKL
ncbi:MAG: GNAT family N-acetyltransferase [Clostridiales bacterium]|jgi:ribosomal protein S18 acetylase RimI-like enzyme|nr:GNAT family N-acetyltransferase [Clostridiales bacterium]